MHSLATVALGAFAIIFFCAALIVGLIILKKYKAEQTRINELTKRRLEEKQKNK
jgi:hypothetical protein